MSQFIDLTLQLDNECMTCGTPWHEKVSVERKGTIKTVGRNTSRIVLGSHSGTHMDAPFHFIDEGRGIEKTDIDICVGPVTCVDLSSKTKGSIVEKEDLCGVNISERMLFVFGWYKKWKTDEYYDSFPYFSEDAIKHLIESGMKLMALDTPSPDTGNAISEKTDSPNHMLLLRSDVIIIEYLCNTDVIDFKKNYEIISLPLKIQGADGSPARVILREV